MEELDNLTQDDVLDLIQDFPLQPMFRNLIITINNHEPDGNIILHNNSFSETQYVVASGSHSDIKAGQKILLDVEKMIIHRENPDNAHEKIASVKLKTVEVDNRVFAIVPESYVDCLDNR